MLNLEPFARLGYAAKAAIYAIAALGLMKSARMAGPSPSLGFVAARRLSWLIFASSRSTRDREAYRPVRTALLLIDAIRRHHPQDFAWSKSIDWLTGSDKVRLAIDGGTLPALLEHSGIARLLRSASGGSLSSVTTDVCPQLIAETSSAARRSFFFVFLPNGRIIGRGHGPNHKALNCRLAAGGLDVSFALEST